MATEPGLMGASLAAMLPADAPAEMRAAVAAGADSLDLSVILQIVTDAQTARDLLANGYPDEARAIVEQYRALADSAGLGPLYEQMLGTILG